ncbi:hypothetical protein MUU72_14050 [Streptomyces sp. RS10V-4]|uniref:YqeB family protein n=1 Tax=Streptomyces rhizoryzae TaxID=2932493 RepID=UPI002004BB78|nr:hypothetical protein [Streptomyces rhizoryzae]MCK7624207.1 hypothetical protein [Streptomyces rhizoryzae]
MQKERNPKADETTVLAEPVSGQVLVCVVLGLLGAGLGWLAEVVANWLVTLPWAPLQGPAKLLTSIPRPGLTIGLVALGAVAGVVAGWLIALHELKVEVSARRVVLGRKGETREIPGEEITLAFRDGKELVLLGRKTEELAREECDHKPARLAEAFTAHGYAWADEDPHKEEFRLWVPDSPELPAQAHAVLKARAETLRKPGGDEPRELRDELRRLGIVVRDADKRQYWRSVSR